MIKSFSFDTCLILCHRHLWHQENNEMILILSFKLTFQW